MLNFWQKFDFEALAPATRCKRAADIPFLSQQKKCSESEFVLVVCTKSVSEDQFYLISFQDNFEHERDLAGPGVYLPASEPEV